MLDSSLNGQIVDFLLMAILVKQAQNVVQFNKDFILYPTNELILNQCQNFNCVLPLDPFNKPKVKVYYTTESKQDAVFTFFYISITGF